MTQEPLPERIKNECASAAQSREPVLLVGTDHSLLELVACRIHALTPARQWPPGPELRKKQYVKQSCRGKSSEWVHGPNELIDKQNVPSPLKIYLADNDTVHLSDVESASDPVASHLITKLHATITEVRLVFSSTIEPAKWRSQTNGKDKSY